MTPLVIHTHHHHHHPHTHSQNWNLIIINCRWIFVVSSGNLRKQKKKSDFAYMKYKYHNPQKNTQPFCDNEQDHNYHHQLHSHSDTQRASSQKVKRIAKTPKYTREKKISVEVDWTWKYYIFLMCEYEARGEEKKMKWSWRLTKMMMWTRHKRSKLSRTHCPSHIQSFIVSVSAC